MLLVALVAVLVSANNGGDIEGVVVNGTNGDKPVPNAEVVLRAGKGSSLSPVAVTTADALGRFRFSRLPTAEGLIYLPGANHQEVHYPGPRLQLREGQEIRGIKVRVHEAVAEPSPLTASNYLLEINVKTGFIEVTESLTVENRTLRTYVGRRNNEASPDSAPTTLTLHIPENFERVTFQGEFFGRNFKVVDRKLSTDIPWTPGSRDLKYTYVVPLDREKRAFSRPLDLNVDSLRIQVRGTNEAVCNLPQVDSSENSIAFESKGRGLPRDFQIELKLHAVALPWIAYARWLTVITLIGLIVATIAFHRRRWSRQAATKSATESKDLPSQSSSPPREATNRRRRSKKRAA